MADQLDNDLEVDNQVVPKSSKVSNCIKLEIILIMWGILWIGLIFYGVIGEVLPISIYLEPPPPPRSQNFRHHNPMFPSGGHNNEISVHESPPRQFFHLPPPQKTTTKFVYSSPPKNVTNSSTSSPNFPADSYVLSTDKKAEETSYGPPPNFPYNFDFNFHENQHRPQNNFQHRYSSSNSNPGSYGPPKFRPFSPIGPPRPGPPPSHYRRPNQNQPKIVKYVSVFVAPTAPEFLIENEPEEKVNIIFIKNPAYHLRQQKPTMEKTVVYVLNEVPGGPSKNPPPQSKPHVHFLQYKKNEGHQPRHDQYFKPSPIDNFLDNIHNHNKENNNHHRVEHVTTSYGSVSGSGQNVHKSHQNVNADHQQNYLNPTGNNLINGQIPNPFETNYAPAMSHGNYLNKRETYFNRSENSSSSGSDESNFRPYMYATNMDHHYYGVSSNENNKKF